MSFHILKKNRHYKETTHSHIILNRYCWHLSLTIVIIRNGKDITCYERIHFGEVGKNCPQTQSVFLMNLFLLHMMKFFCYECIVRLLKFCCCDLNEITPECIAFTKTLK